MSERIQRRRSRSEETTGHEQDFVVASAPTTVDYDAVLAEIDEVLSTDASEYVRSFVQKGGQ